MVCALGLEHCLVGTSHECDYPPSVRELPAVTQTRIDHHASSSEIDRQVREELGSQLALYSLDQAMLKRLRPDLIVTQSLCDVCAVAEAEVTAFAHAQATAATVFNLQPMSLDDVLEAVSELAKAAMVPSAGERLRNTLTRRIELVRSRSMPIGQRERPRVAFLEWLDPPFNAGHWNPELVEIAGGTSILGVAGEPSTTINWDDVANSDPDRLIIGCCGFDTARTLSELKSVSKPGWDDLRCVRAGNVFVMDGNAYFNRPGPRLVDSLELLAHTLHPLHHPLPSGLCAAIQLRFNSE
jgi:iron complex transport system substrate-binding protein